MTAADISPRPNLPHRRLLYLHGFRSSPQSFKAEFLRRHLAQHAPQVAWVCPQLLPSPAETMALLRQLTQGWSPLTDAVVGSSLGGFYATALAVERDLRAVVINPAVAPARDLSGFVGELSAYHDPQVRFEFKASYLDELRAIDTATGGRTGRTLAIIATGDELLDWQEMAQRFAKARTHIIEGSDHGLSDFEHHLPHLLNFLELP
jgi:uncharacterized protein